MAWALKVDFKNEINSPLKTAISEQYLIAKKDGYCGRSKNTC